MLKVADSNREPDFLVLAPPEGRYLGLVSEKDTVILLF